MKRRISTLILLGNLKNCDDYTDCNWYGHRKIGNGTGKLENKRTRGDHPNYCINKIIQNTKKSPRDLRRLAVKVLKRLDVKDLKRRDVKDLRRLDVKDLRRIAVKDHQLTLM